MKKRKPLIFIDSFSGDAVDLKGPHRSSENVLACLKKSPRLSTWDMSEHAWLRGCIAELEKKKQIEQVPEPYPWHRWKIMEQSTP